ncbi:hypothetical protein BV25DRAFT_1186658 [Artomyces pyxidatus]|uniref:Uncharacterized protein n=1 Tax=Artomyces pyxidatus TaxID=48021 RepID=A0ACB8SSX1_9AGAM|nr:hypothetical protein BV25DRAFT_1186658 [Artomyces pyxidatus]
MTLFMVSDVPLQPFYSISSPLYAFGPFRMPGAIQVCHLRALSEAQLLYTSSITSAFSDATFEFSPQGLAYEEKLSPLRLLCVRQEGPYTLCPLFHYCKSYSN